MVLMKDIKMLLSGHYIVNILLSIVFVVLKTVPPVCNILFPTSPCELDFREWEIITFLAIVVVFRTRRSGSTSMLAYLSLAFTYCKIANLALFFYADFRMAVCYAVFCILQMLLVPEPAYSGPENITYFRGLDLKEEIDKDRRVIWLVCFYAAWSPACVTLAPVFSQLSGEFTLENLKFGKLDITRYPDAAKEFCINDSSFSRQLPTIIMFKNGKEVDRRPTVDHKNNFVRFYFSEGNIKTAFDLPKLYEECKKNPLKDRKKKLEESIEESADGKVKAE